MRKIKKYVLAYTLCVLLGLTLGRVDINNELASSEHNRQIYVNSLMNYHSIDTILEDADVVVEATIKDITEYNQYEAYDVEISQVLKGNYESSSMIVRNYYMNYSYEYNNMTINGSTNCNYELGKKYIFVLQHINNVYDERYAILADTYLPIYDENNSTILSLPITVDESPIHYVREFTYTKSTGTGENLSIPYTDSVYLEDIVKASSYIAEIEVVELNSTSDTADLFRCKVLNIYKGDMNVMDNNEIYVLFLKNTMSVGNKNVVLLNSESSLSFLYTLSSKNSVYSLNEVETIDYILQGE